MPVVGAHAGVAVHPVIAADRAEQADHGSCLDVGGGGLQHDDEIPPDLAAGRAGRGRHELSDVRLQRPELIFATGSEQDPGFKPERPAGLPERQARARRRDRKADAQESVLQASGIRESFHCYEYSRVGRPPSGHNRQRNDSNKRCAVAASLDQVLVGQR